MWSIDHDHGLIELIIGAITSMMCEEKTILRCREKARKIERDEREGDETGKREEIGKTRESYILFEENNSIWIEIIKYPNFTDVGHLNTLRIYLNIMY